MAVITRTITNNLSTNLDLFVPGYNTIKPQVVIAPSATVDLFTVITGDELEAIQNQLALLVANSSITVNATVNTNTFNPVGGGTGGITALTGDVTASGTGSVAATVHNATNLTSQVITGNGSSIPLQLKPSADSITAIEVTNAAGSGTPLMIFDTIDGFVGINVATPHRPLAVGGDASVGGNFLANVLQCEQNILIGTPATQAEIVGGSPTLGLVYVASDTNVILFANGTGWFTLDMTPA